MPFDLGAVLPRLLPRAAAWAEARSNEILREGTPLSAAGLSLARTVGVHYPERIRVSRVDRIPMPEDAELRAAAIQTSLLGPGTAGLTLGYGVYVRSGHVSNRLLSHEFRHVFQYELEGSIAGFLRQYLQQIVEFGYDQAPYEVDARDHECDFSQSIAQALLR